MLEETGSFRAADGLSLFTRSWLPDAPRAAVTLLHGYGEHSGRYAHVADFLVARGLAVHTFDYRGHGRSEGDRAFFERFDWLVEDALAFFATVRARHQGLKHVFLGHSTGGAVALHCALREEAKEEAGKEAGADALILSSPYLRNAVPVSRATAAVARFLSRTVPLLPVIRLNSEAISRDPEVVRAYRGDPLVYSRRVRARVAAELSGAGPALEARLAELSLPILILCGSEDRIAALEGSRLLFERAGSEDKTLEVYDGHYHELFNDYDKERVISDMLDWLEARL